MAQEDFGTVQLMGHASRARTLAVITLHIAWGLSLPAAYTVHKWTTDLTPKSCLWKPHQMPSSIALTRSSLREGTRASGPLGSPASARAIMIKQVRNFKLQEPKPACMWWRHSALVDDYTTEVTTDICLSRELTWPGLHDMLQLCLHLQSPARTSQ